MGSRVFRTTYKAMSYTVWTAVLHKSFVLPYIYIYMLWQEQGDVNILFFSIKALKAYGRSTLTP